MMRIRTVDDFGAVARLRRRELGHSQEELAKRAGVTRQWLVRFERDSSDVSLAKVFAVLRELNLIVRADPVVSADSPLSPRPKKYAVPKIDMPQLNMDVLRRSLEAVRQIPSQDELVAMRDAIRQLDSARLNPRAQDD
ncbi:transcriptional regulator with XRE-family HTH domain [Marisediminicola sp. UYEF4]|uniref:helix-turn-helix domain-containing protein n=1 Tax=Marisediminicola sp. UYEF4 TaxID=1756384 RepID=UPI00339816DE